MMKMLAYSVYVFAALFALYTVYAAFFYGYQRKLIFPAHVAPNVMEQAVEVAPESIRWFEKNGARVESWLLPALSENMTDKSPAILIAHGNGEVIDEWLPKVKKLREMGFIVMLVEYPSYGRSTGSPSQPVVVDLFLQAYDHLVNQPSVDTDNIVLLGRSLGGGVIAQVADKRPSKALFLFSTFTSLIDMAREKYKLPAWLVKDAFNTKAVIENYPGYVYLLHGTEDEVTPFSHSLSLRSASKKAILQRFACGHSDCIGDWDKYWISMIPTLQKFNLPIQAEVSD